MQGWRVVKDMHVIFLRPSSITFSFFSQEEVATAVGVRSVIDAISRSKKRIVSHNGLFDLCYIYESFYNPLPGT